MTLCFLLEHIKGYIQAKKMQKGEKVKSQKRQKAKTRKYKMK